MNCCLCRWRKISWIDYRRCSTSITELSPLSLCSMCAWNTRIALFNVCLEYTHRFVQCVPGIHALLCSMCAWNTLISECRCQTYISDTSSKKALMAAKTLFWERKNDFNIETNCKRHAMPGREWDEMKCRCFRPLFCTMKVELGRGQLGLMRWNWEGMTIEGMKERVLLCERSYL